MSEEYEEYEEPERISKEEMNAMQKPRPPQNQESQTQADKKELTPHETSIYLQGFQAGQLHLAREILLKKED